MFILRVTVLCFIYRIKYRILKFQFGIILYYTLCIYIYIYNTVNLSRDTIVSLDLTQDLLINKLSESSKSMLSSDC